MNSYFPDVNVWLALTLKSHQAFPSARQWYGSLPASTDLVFSRASQMGFLRLLTTRSVSLAATRTQREAWVAYDHWITEGGARFSNEPIGLEQDFRSRTKLDEAAAKGWTDSYLAAFSHALAMPLVTFDKALSKRSPGSILLSL